MIVSYGAHGADFDPDVSRDGDRIVFASTQHRPTADIYSKRVGARSITQLTSDPANDVMPAFSPTGGRVAFASDRAGSWDLYVMNRSGGQAVQLTGSDAHELHPSWSPDGSMLAYCRLGPVSGRWELWVMNTENPAVRHFIGYGLFPEWNPVSNKILFQRARERGDRLFSVWTLDFENGEGRNPTEVISSPAAAIVNPTWSPDGARIAFATITSPAHVYGDRPDSADLWIVDADGSNRANLTGGSFVNLMPSWGRDNRIYFVSDRSGRDSIWSVLPERAIIAAGGQPTRNLANVPDEGDD
jgi:TolB protein